MIRSEILVRGTANANWGVGDVVAIRPVGFRWGDKECEPNFKILKSNVPPKSGSREYVGDWAFETVDKDGLLTKHIKARSKWCYVAAKGVLYNKETLQERKLDEL